MKHFAKLGIAISSSVLGIAAFAANIALAQEQPKTQSQQAKASEKTVPQLSLKPSPILPAASPKNPAVSIKPAVGVSQISQSPVPQSQIPQSDLLASVRNQASRLRSVPISGGSQSLRDSKAHRDADQIKMLHDWQGDTTTAAWPFTIGKSKK